jgi:hypothetical protein
MTDHLRYRSIGGLHYVLAERDPTSAAAGGEHWSLSSCDVVTSSPLDVVPHLSPEVDCMESSVGAEQQVSAPESSSTEHGRSAQRLPNVSERCRDAILPQVNATSGYVAPASTSQTARFSDTQLCGTYKIF